MIFGRKQKQVPPGRIWDYVACLYNVFFNHSEIEEIYFVGYEDDEELFTRNLLLNM